MRKAKRERGKFSRLKAKLSANYPLTIKERSAVAEILTGFIVGALLFPLWLWGYSGNINPTSNLIMACAIPAAILLAVSRTVFEKRRLHSAVKLIINVGLWSGQTAAASSTIPLIANTQGAGQFLIFVFAFLALLFINREDVKLTFSFGSAQIETSVTNR